MRIILSKGILFTLAVACWPAFAQELGYSRKDFGAEEPNERDIVVEGQTYQVGINEGAAINQNGISSPEIIYLDSYIPPQQEDNEAPPGSTEICCYALVTSTGEVLSVQPYAERIIGYASIDEFKELYYYEAHSVMEITDKSGIYAESEQVTFDSDIQVSFNANSDDCNYETMSPVFTSLPSICAQESFTYTDEVNYGSTAVGTDSTYYRSGHRGVSAICLADTFSVGPYAIEAAFQPNAVETTCNRQTGGHGEVAAVALRPSITGRLSRTGLGENIPFAMLFDRDNEERDFVSENVGGYGWLLPPFVSQEKMEQVRPDRVTMVEVENAIVLRDPSVSQAYSGFMIEEYEGKTMQLGAFYGGHVLDEATLCVFTDILGTLGSPDNAYGTKLNKNIISTDVGDRIEAEAQDHNEKCLIIRDAYHGAYKGYLVPALGSVFSFEVKDGSLGVRMPFILTKSFEDDFWQESDAVIGQDQPRSFTIVGVLTNLVQKSE